MAAAEAKESAAAKPGAAKQPRVDHGYRVSGVGDQCQSQRSSAPHHTVSRRIGREGAGPIYPDPGPGQYGANAEKDASKRKIYPGTLAGPSYAFSKAKAHDLLPSSTAAGGIDSNNTMQVTVDNQYGKYARDATILIGTEPRGRLKDAELIRNHQAAFFGRASPGPAGQGGDYGPKVDATKPRQAPARPFGQRLKTDWLTINDTPEKVGPDSYKRKDDSIGQQHLTKRVNQPVHLFQQGAKFPKSRSADQISALDAATSAFGKQSLGKNKSEPTIGFGRGSRDGRSRSALCVTNADLGPKATMPKFTACMPKLPSEAAVMRCGIG